MLKISDLVVCVSLTYGSDDQNALNLKLLCPFLHMNFHPEGLLLQYLFAFNRNQISKMLCHRVKVSPRHPLKSYLHYRTNLIKNPIGPSPFLVRLEKF